MTQSNIDSQFRGNQMSLSSYNPLYNIVEAFRMQISPARISLHLAMQFFETQSHSIYDSDYAKFMHASLEIIERMTRKYQKPQFNIHETTMDGIKHQVVMQTVLSKTFCNLQHFKKVQDKSDKKEPQSKLLIIAPMAGHHATLLRGTIQDLLPFFDVYVTDWIDASQVPLNMGKFDMDDFIEYLISFIKHLGTNVHAMAVCQPTVPLIAATAIMSKEKDKYTPKSMILIGGPVDARKNPTKVSAFGADYSIDFLERFFITQVPSNYPGYMRSVYPGFLQLMSFMSLNWNRHFNSHIDLFKNLMIEDDQKADLQKQFYDEYLSVMDLPAEFYLQTVKSVFQDYALAKGSMVSKGRLIDLGAITNCALLGIEGENDDIAAVGQTKEALHLCKNVSKSMKHYYLQKGVGHYGVFSGSKFRKYIVPVIKDFISQQPNV